MTNLLEHIVENDKWKASSTHNKLQQKGNNEKL